MHPREFHSAAQFQPDPPLMQMIQTEKELVQQFVVAEI